MSELPEAVERIKPALREQCRVDMSAFVVETAGRTVVPYDGESVWLEPYVDADMELELMRARDSLGDDPSDVEAFEMMCGILAGLILAWNLTDKYGEPLPQPESAEDVRKLPSRAVLFLLNEALGVESPGEGPSASGATPTGSSATARRRTKRK